MWSGSGQGENKLSRAASRSRPHGALWPIDERILRLLPQLALGGERPFFADDDAAVPERRVFDSEFPRKVDGLHLAAEGYRQ